MTDLSSEKTVFGQTTAPGTGQEEAEAAIFAQEQAHLSKVYNKLQAMEQNLEERISAIADKAAAEKLDIRENLALNFDGDSESMETYIEFEVMNHAIDQYNIDRDTADEKLSRVKRLLKAPYFAKVLLQFEPDEDPEEYYIGSAGVAEHSQEPLVIDWRSPVAETYYNQDNGKTFYTVDGRRICCGVSLSCRKTGCRPFLTHRLPSRIPSSSTRSQGSAAERCRRSQRRSRGNRMRSCATKTFLCCWSTA